MDDLISRSSVLKGIEELQKSPWYNYGKELDRNFPYPHLEYIARKEAVIVIHDLCIKKEPAVDAAPVVHGRWTKKNDQGVFYCSECDLPSLEWWPYCERCGAKMETEISNITKTKFAPSLDDAIKEFNAKWTISGARMDGGD